MSMSFLSPRLRNLNVQHKASETLLNILVFTTSGPVQAALLILELEELQKSDVDVEGHMLTTICSGRCRIQVSKVFQSKTYMYAEPPGQTNRMPPATTDTK